jgi:hypothetical protein
MAVLVAAGAVLIIATACARSTSSGTVVLPSAPASTRVGSPSPAQQCPPPGVLITAERGEAAMGYRELTLSLHNCGAAGYQVRGRPDIVVLDEDQQPLEVAVVPSAHYTATPRPISAPPGSGAMAVLSWRNTVTDPTVKATVGAFLSVAPMAGAPRQLVRLPSPMDLGNTGRLEVSAWL